MKRIALLVATTLLLSAPVTATAMAASVNGNVGGKNAIDGELAVITLNNRISIQDGVIRLGDLFQGVGEYAERVIAYAPRPGSRAVFDARWLKRVAAAFKLDWRPSSAAERIVVERESLVITKSEIETLLFERLVAEGGDPSSRVSLANRSFRLHLPVGEDYLLGIEQISFDSTTGRFSSVLAWGNAKDERRRVTGRMERMTEVPVLAKRIMGGALIEEGDLKWVELPQARLARNAITDASQLIGMAAKRTISAGKPVTANNVSRPKDIAKGQTVMMVLSTPSMRLTTKGKALESGAAGDTIRISNSQTSTVIEGVITGPGQVRVDAQVNLAMR